MKKLSNPLNRLRQFIVEDVRRNPFLGLYVIIGVMAVGYLIYFVGILYKDFAGGEGKQAASKTKVESAQKAPEAPKPATVEKTAMAVEKSDDGATPQLTHEQTTPSQTEPLAKATTEQMPPASGATLDVDVWQKVEFPDGSRISYPPDWGRTEISAEKNILYGIQLQAPDSRASLKCYSLKRQAGDDIARTLKETMTREGSAKIREESKKVNKLDVVELNGVLADKHMVVSIFDNQSDKYFIFSLIAPEREYTKLQSYYDAIVRSYGSAKTPAGSTVSIEKIEKQLFKSIKEGEEYLVGSTVMLKLKSGARHKGVVIAEDDTTLTIESIRFGGRYSFKVRKEDIVEIIH